MASRKKSAGWPCVRNSGDDIENGGLSAPGSSVPPNPANSLPAILMHHLAGGTSEFGGRTQGRDGPAAMVLCGRRLSIADQNAVAGIAVARHFDKNDGHLLRADNEFLLQNLSHALGRPAFLRSEER